MQNSRYWNKARNGITWTNTPQLCVGNIQHMVFQEGDQVSYYLPPNIQENRKHDEIRGNKVKHRLRKDSCQDIEWLGITTRGKTIKELQDIAVAWNLRTTIEEDDLVEGWLGKPKVIKQVLWEQGLLDPHWTDPQNATLSWMGECFEYTWGHAKWLCMKARLLDKKGKENFLALIKRCLSTEEGKDLGSLTPAMIRKFSWHAHQYILTYFWIEHKMEEKAKEG